MIKTGAVALGFASVVPFIDWWSDVTSPAQWLALLGQNKWGTRNGEVFGRGYVRLFNDKWKIDNGTATNTKKLVWPRATGDWGLVDQVAIFDAAYGGNLVLSGHVQWDHLQGGGLRGLVHIQKGDAVTFRVGELTWTLL